MRRWNVFADLCLATLVMSCVTSPGKMKDSHLPLRGSSGQVEVQEGVEIAAQLITPEQLISLGAVVCPYGRVDFTPILQDGYVNYAEEDLADLLTSYNLYQRYDHGLERDFFGHPPWLEGWRVNPYLGAEGQSPFLLFMVTVRNRRRGKIAMAASEAVILDSRGNQHRALSPEDLLALSQISTGSTTAQLQRGPPPSWGWVRQLYLKRDVLRRTMLIDQRIFPGVTCTGIVAFEKLAVSGEGFQLVFPEVVLYKGGRPFQALDFRFIFSEEGAP